MADGRGREMQFGARKQEALEARRCFKSAQCMQTGKLSHAFSPHEINSSVDENESVVNRFERCDCPETAMMGARPDNATARPPGEKHARTPRRESVDLSAR